ncbi:7-dehydrosterol-delta 7-reductase [Thamnocephalis sphaerospora]|uniref:7-dehydrocholesterol reductase n=1 Tax=Thamnocephalis sphaerospora TaxID=78915 RepID=A0A4P9XQR4_9FUNG|nr:7-dehydrosterol-delta 7-reductase [Thamnocephalis sphaerospora]|eukprot:RKP08385.1 7-dehydrosterol-delta 7-reductase [Thamnocephalis sphaerospora]
MAVTLRQRNKAGVTAAEKQASAVDDKGRTETWGRSFQISFLTRAICASIIAFCPLMVIAFWSACTHYQCSLMALGGRVLDTPPTKTGLWQLIVDLFPHPTKEGFMLFGGWLIYQGVMYAIVPSMIGYGQRTPAGHRLPYKVAIHHVNGLNIWIITHALFLAGSLQFGLFPASIIADNWGALLVATNVYGYILTVFVYIKAHLFPSHADDRKFSGSWLYDFYMGIEMNPRFGKLWDFKLFHNGRPGICAWTLINLSFAAKEFETKGYVSKEMIALNLMHAVYVVDFFYNEDWYLRTIDIAHDHFGFYLSWGDSVWLPWMYTLQSHYLLRNVVHLSPAVYALVWALEIGGYIIFRVANHQKDYVRRMDGKCKIWGRDARFIRAEYLTSDGKKHSSILLTSGLWGFTQHFNYIGDLMMCTAFCMTCGFQHLLPWFYVIYMSILLVHRTLRDDDRCRAKYGVYWDEYQKAVPWRLIPYVY